MVLVTILFSQISCLTSSLKWQWLTVLLSIFSDWLVVAVVFWSLVCGSVGQSHVRSSYRQAGQGRTAPANFHHFLTRPGLGWLAGSPPDYHSASRDRGDGQAVNMWTNEEGNRPRLSGADSRMPSIQLSSSVSSARMMIISPSSNVSSSSLSASQSYSARHLL